MFMRSVLAIPNRTIVRYTTPTLWVHRFQPGYIAQPDKRTCYTIACQPLVFLPIDKIKMARGSMARKYRKNGQTISIQGIICVHCYQLTNIRDHPSLSLIFVMAFNFTAVTFSEKTAGPSIGIIVLIRLISIALHKA